MVDLGVYLVCLLISLLIIVLALFLRSSLLLPLLLAPLGFAAIKWLENQSRVFEITNQRIKISSGIINRRTDELELYRVKDMTLIEPVWLRLFGLGNIVLVTNDVSTPNLTLAAIPKANALREELRNHVEICREQKKVRLAELE